MRATRSGLRTGRTLRLSAIMRKNRTKAGRVTFLLLSPVQGRRHSKLLTTYSAGGQRLVWSPDGQQLAFLQGIEPKYSAYGMGLLAMVPVAGGTPRVLTAKLDRGVSGAEFTPDGTALTVLVEDDRLSYIGKVPASGGNVERLGKSSVVLSDVESAGGHMAAIGGTDTSALEVYAVENGEPRKLTAHNDALVASCNWVRSKTSASRARTGQRFTG